MNESCTLPKLCSFNEDDHLRLLESTGALLVEIVSSDYNMMSEEQFENNTYENVKRILFLQLQHLYERDIESDIDQIIREALAILYEAHVPKRSFRGTFITGKPDMDYVSSQLDILRNKPQPEQRTAEWYNRRHDLITASNAYLALGSDANYNRLVYEKCQPINTEKFAKVNTESPMHKGQKYEPVSVMLYEDLYGTTVEDFGCITHEKYGFIGASPDGINSDPSSDRYGRMLEIKNISNRLITGIPKREYWIQMQLQMETCGLNECDFLETRFIEYESHDDFKEDGSLNLTKDNKQKGIIVCFSRDEKPVYEYCPLDITEETYDNWEKTVMCKHKDDSWIQNVYWKLDELSCVLVLRNEHWFNAIVPKMAELWQTVVKERVEGYTHRAPKKRVSKVAPPPDKDDTVFPEKCLIQLDGLDGLDGLDAE